MKWVFITVVYSRKYVVKNDRSLKDNSKLLLSIISLWLALVLFFCRGSVHIAALTHYALLIPTHLYGTVPTTFRYAKSTCHYLTQYKNYSFHYDNVVGIYVFFKQCVILPKIIWCSIIKSIFWHVSIYIYSKKLW